MTDSTFYRVITRDDTGTRWAETRNTDDDSVYSVHEHWTLAEKIEILASTFGKDSIRYADRASWHIGYERNAVDHWTFYDRCPRYVSYSEVHSYPEIMTRAYVDLTDIGKSECQAGQSTTLDRSNFRKLTEDYPDTFTPTAYSNVDVLGAYVGNLPEDVIDILCGLKTDYRVYDEEDMSALESEEETESYEQYAKSDLASEIAGTHTADMWDALDDATQESMFWQAAQECDYPCEHDGYSANWDYGKMAGALHTVLERYFLDGETNPDQETLQLS